MSEPSLRDSITAAMDSQQESSTPTPEPSAAAAAPSVSSTPPATPDPAAADPKAQSKTRGPDGKFVAGEARPPVPQSAPVDPAAPPAALAATAPVDPAAPLGGVKPPVGFPDVKAWSALPDGARTWIRNREVEFQQGITKYAQAAKFAGAVQQVLSPYMASIQARGIHPVQLIQEYAATHELLTRGSPREKQQAFLRVAQLHGIDLNTLLTEQPSQGPEDPRIAQLEQAVTRMSQMLHGREQQQSQEEANRIWSGLDKFAKDPQREHFPILYERMARLIETGAAQGLDDAYETAMWERPDLRTMMQERHAAELARQAAAARQSSTVGGGAPVAGSSSTVPDTVRGALEQAFERHAA